MKEDTLGILILLGIIAIALYGGSMKSKNASPALVNNNSNYSQTKQEYELKKELKDAQKQVNELKAQVEAEQDKKYKSQYYGLVKISYVNQYSQASGEYVELRVDSNTSTNIPITGWTLKSSSGQSVSIPKGTYLYFSNTQNSEENIVVSKNDLVYISTGYSPNGVNFKVNKCSGYLQQSQKFSPSLSYSCPLPRNEDLSSIPKLAINDACFDYIDRLSSCRTVTGNIPVNWSYECKNFLYEKVTYPSCINTHKGDKDFYKNDWRIYLKRSEKLWKEKKETITLYDGENKIVATYNY